MNCEVKSANICFNRKSYARDTLEDLKNFKVRSHHDSTDRLLDALISAIRNKIDEGCGICVEIGDC